jgi:hypothetical protein
MALTFPTDSRTVGRITSLTVDEIAPDIIDAAFGDFATLNAIMNAPGVKQEWDGSDQAGFPVTLEKQAAGAAIDPFEVVDMTPGNTETRANFEPKLYASSIVVAIANLQRLGGDLAAVNYLTHRTRHAVKKTMDLLNGADGLYSDATNGKAIVGLRKIFEDPQSTGVYGGISRAGNPQHRSVLQDNNNTTANVLSDLRTLHTLLTSGNDMPDLILTTRTGRDVYESKLTATLETDPIVIGRTGEGAVGDAGILGLTYKGIPMVVDEDFQLLDGLSNWMMLNTRYLNFKVHPEADFSTTEIQESEDQHILKGKVVWHGLFGCSHLRRQGIVHDGPSS